MTDPSRFWSHVRKTAGCWYWEGNLNDCGYGRLKIQGALRSAHRVAYELAIGPIPAGALVRQQCGERACCRPDHLRLLQFTRLTRERIEAIRGSMLSGRRLAQIYRVSQARIWQLKHDPAKS